MTAGHDELRGLGPDQRAALEAHDITWVFPIPGLNRLAITSLSTLTQLGPCALAERCGDPVCWSIQEYGWMFAGLARARHVKRSKDAHRSVAAGAIASVPARRLSVE